MPVILLGMGNVVTAHGRNGQVSFDGHMVTITREGFAARLSHGRSEKRIPLNRIGSVQMKPVSLMTTGFIQFSVPGEVTNSSQKGSRSADAAADENAVLFTKKQQPEFETLNAALQSALALA